MCYKHQPQKKPASFIIKVPSSVSEKVCLEIVQTFLQKNYPNEKIKIHNNGQMNKLPCEIEIKDKKVFHTYTVPLGGIDIKEKNDWNFFILQRTQKISKNKIVQNIGKN